MLSACGSISFDCRRGSRRAISRTRLIAVVVRVYDGLSTHMGSRNTSLRQTAGGAWVAAGDRGPWLRQHPPAARATNDGVPAAAAKGDGGAGRRAVWRLLR